MIPVYQPRPFVASLYFARLARSLSKVGIENPHTTNEWLDLFSETIKRNTPENQVFYIQVSRGVASRQHTFPAGIIPTIFIMSQPFSPYPDEIRQAGLSCVTMKDSRWHHCDIKSTSLLGSVLAAQEAKYAGAQEAVLFRDGILSEGASSNVWLVKDGNIFGAPIDCHILEGIRSVLIREFCTRQGISLILREISRAEIFSADEVFITSALREALAVTTIDGKTIGIEVSLGLFIRHFMLTIEMQFVKTEPNFP